MIRVNHTHFDETAIIKEMQYHPAETHTEAKNKACEALIIGELLKQRAAELKLHQPEKNYDGCCSGGACSEAHEDEPAKAEAFLDQLLEIEVDFPTATEADCRQYFEANPKKFMTSPLVEASHILLDAAPDDAQARSEANELAIQLITRLQADPGLFAELAGLHSRCPSSKVGGSLGQLGKGQTVPEFERQLFNCSVGLAGAPIETRYGVHVVLIHHREEGRPLPFEMVQQRIADYLNEKVRRKAIAQYIYALISEADIEGFEFDVSASPLMQ
jgi:peptidyl-prolyl cis-trans isomerase C